MALPCLRVSGSRYSWHIVAHAVSIGKRVSLVCMPMFSVPPSGLPCVRENTHQYSGCSKEEVCSGPLQKHPRGVTQKVDSAPRDGRMDGWIDGRTAGCSFAGQPRAQEAHGHEQDPNSQKQLGMGSTPMARGQDPALSPQHRYVGEAWVFDPLLISSPGKSSYWC